MRRFLLDRAAASAAEFALVLPAALLLMFGVIDVGRYVWQLNEYEKAVQLGARYAVATAVVPRTLDRADFHGQICNGNTLGFGDTICAEAMDTIECTSTDCSCPAGGAGLCACPTGSCPSSSETNYNATAFNNLLNRMRVASKRISATDISVEYAGSGLGYVGDPATTTDNDGDNERDPLPDPSPIVTVKLTNMRYQPITLTLVGVDVPYPDFSYSLTLEDGDGAVAS